MAQGSSKNAVRAGVFVLATIALTVAVIVVLAGLTEKLRPTSSYIVRFDLTDGAAGLEVDSNVQVGGRKVGRVTRVNFERGASDVLTGILVEIAIDKNLTIRDGATAYLERPLLGSGAALNFESLGEASSPPLEQLGVITGEPQVPQFMAQAGYGSTQREQLQSVLARADELSAKFDDIAENIRAITVDARGRSGGWFDQTDAILEDVRNSAADVRARIDEGKKLIASLQEGIDTNRPRVDEILANAQLASEDVRDATEHFNEHTVALVDGLLQDGRDGAAEARASLERIDTLIAEQSPAIRKSIANARLASDQLRLASGEIRRTPWRLLYRPTEKDLEFELLYDAARAYADAVSDLRDASETLDAISTSNPAVSNELVRVSDEIADAFTRYNSAEQRFLDLLSSNSP